MNMIIDLIDILRSQVEVPTCPYLELFEMTRVPRHPSFSTYAVGMAYTPSSAVVSTAGIQLQL